MATVGSSYKKVRARLKKWFNLYIRLRDVSENGYGRCISCNEIKHFSKLDAGHFVSVGASSALEFNEMNVYAQCRHCNSFDSGDSKAVYTINLQRKIGFEKVELLLGMKYQKGLSIGEMELLIPVYKEKCENLLKVKNVSYS